MAQHIPRLLLAEELHGGVSLVLTDADRLHHLRGVLRVKAGDTLHVFNAQDGEWEAVVATISKRDIALNIGERLHMAPVADKQHIHLAFAPLKRTATEWLVEKLAEIGVNEITPVLTDHTQTRMLNSERLNAMMIDAVEQCGSFAAPSLNPLVPLKDFLRQWDKNIVLYIALEGERDENTIFNPDQAASHIGILIGPEGGWSADEVVELKDRPFIKPISLGRNILRAETAAIAACVLAKIRD